MLQRNYKGWHRHTKQLWVRTPIVIHADWKAKLRPSQVLKAYDHMHNKGYSCSEMAQYFNVARTTMASIRCGKSWAWLTCHNDKTKVI